MGLRRYLLRARLFICTPLCYKTSFRSSSGIREKKYVNLLRNWWPTDSCIAPNWPRVAILVEEAVRRLDRERYAPLLPSLLLDVSQSGYGGGPDSVVSDFSGRFDFDATVYWELRNFGLGDAAAQKAARSRLEQSRQLQIQLMDRVAREIVEAHAQSESLRGQIAVAESGIRVASESYRRNLERIRGGQGLPLEGSSRCKRLDQSCREYLRAVGDYDEWQFRLYRALGCPIPQEANPTK